MGNTSSMLTQYDIEEVQEHCKHAFTQQEIVSLYQRFCQLDRNNSGFISSDEFLSIPEFAVNPLSQSLLRMLDGLNFKEFVAFLSAFSPRATLQHKIEFVFKVYDTDCNGKVTFDDMLRALRDLTGQFMSEQQREEVLTQVLEEAGYEKDSLLVLSDFMKVLMARWCVLKPYTLPAHWIASRWQWAGRLVPSDRMNSNSNFRLLYICAMAWNADKIYPEREAWRLRVRVIRLWIIPSFSGTQLPGSMEMVLMDEHGGKIHATVRKPLVYKFQPLLTEGGIYRLAYFGVVPNVGGYRTTNHPFKLLFQFRTTVNECGSVIIPPYGLSLSTFQQVLNNEDDSDFLVDVIGLLTAVSPEREYERDGKPTKMLTIELFSHNLKLDCALFGEYVDQLKAFISAGELEEPVVVIQFAKVKMFRGKIGIQNVMYATRLMFNPEIAEAIEFRNSLADLDLVVSQPLTVPADGARTSLEEDFMRQTPRMSLKNVSEVKQDGFYVVFGTVKGVVGDGGWFYTACQCSRAVSVDSGLYYCDSCSCHVVNVTPRYKVKVEVQDQTAAAVLVLFDREAQYLFKKSCSDLFSAYQKGGRGTGFPSVFNEIVGKKMLFKVETKSVPTPNSDGSLRVKRVCDDETILSMFELEGSDVTPTKSLFAPPFPAVYSLGSQSSDVEVIQAEEFATQALANSVSSRATGSSYVGGMTPCKRKLEDDLDDVGSGGWIKAVKQERE